MKKVLSLMLAVTVLFTFVPYVYAANIVDYGTCGDSIKWTLDDDGVLTIDGAGKMTDFDSYFNTPWYSYASKIKSVIINGDVTGIGNYAFNECDNLTSITIPSSVTSIGNDAFSCCSSLTSIDIPNSVTSIGAWAFNKCSSLTSITIPNSVTSIGSRAFYSCDSLTSIAVDENNKNYCSIDGNLFNKDKTVLIRYAVAKTDKEYTIPNSVISIDDWAFSDCSSLTSITIPNSVSSVGVGAFSHCGSLTSITIPSSVTYIEDLAFYGCIILTSIDVDENNKDFCSISGDLFNKDKSVLIQYAEGKTDKEYAIPNSVTSIGNYAFSECDNLSSIYIPNCVTSIGNFAFSECDNLSSIYIPSSVTSIGDFAFNGCNCLIDVYYSGTKSQWNDISIGSYDECLTNVTIHCESTSEEPSIVDGGACGDSIKWTIDDFGTLTIDGTGKMTDWADSFAPWYSYASKIKSVIINGDVTSIGRYAFYGCRSLTNITIPNSVTSIGSCAFLECSGLTDVYYSGTESQWSGISIDSGIEFLTNVKIHCESTSEEPSIVDCGTCGDSLKWTLDDGGVLTIYGAGKMTYWTDSSAVPWNLYASKIKSVIINGDVTSIGDSAFSRCSSLTNITIPNSVTSIGNIAFDGCSGLTDVYYSGTKSQWSDISIGSYNECLTNATIHCESTSEEPFDTVSVTEVSLNKTSLELNIGESEMLTATVFPLNATNKNVKWSSSSENIATVSEDGTVTAKSDGTAVITAASADGGKTAVCEVTVGYTVGYSGIVTVESVSGNPGDEIVVPVSISGNKGIAGYKFILKYDISKLIPVDIVKGESLGGSLTSNMKETGVDLSTLDYITALWSSESDFSGDGELFSVKFKIADNVEVNTKSEITVSYNSGDIVNQNLNDVNINVVNGSVSIEKLIYGDIYRDGCVNNKDLVRLRQYLAEWDIELSQSELKAADVYKDTTINNKDLVRLSQYLAEWNVKLGE